jgi:hypothetical protein
VFIRIDIIIDITQPSHLAHDFKGASRAITCNPVSIKKLFVQTAVRDGNYQISYLNLRLCVTMLIVCLKIILKVRTLFLHNLFIEAA